MTSNQVNELVAKASVLTEALPYIKRFYGKTIVIKYGGKAMTDESLKESIMVDIVLMRYVGMNPVIVHGGGPEINALMERVGKQASFVDGLRVTDAETMELVQMVLVGKLNKEIVALITKQGAKAVGLSGKDGSLLLASKKFHRKLGGNEAVDIGFVGSVAKVNPEVLNVVIGAGYIPVIAPVGYDEEGQSYNINADEAAGAIAAALGAEKFVLLTDVEGIYSRPGDPSSLISVITASQIQELVNKSVIEGGMIPKVEACVAALRGGVKSAHIVNGRVNHALLLEIFTDRGIGTMVIEG